MPYFRRKSPIVALGAFGSGCDVSGIFFVARICPLSRSAILLTPIFFVLGVLTIESRNRARDDFGAMLQTAIDDNREFWQSEISHVRILWSDMTKAPPAHRQST